MKPIGALLCIFAWALLPNAATADGFTVRDKLTQEADFQVLVIGIHVDKFDMGLYDFDPETNKKRRLRISREGSLQFFKEQKHKGMILVRYYGVSYDRKDWDPEIDRTVQFFKSAGYERIVLFQEYGQVPGVSVIYDTSGFYSKHQFIPFEYKTEPNQTPEPTPTAVTPDADASAAPSAGAAHL